MVTVPITDDERELSYKVLELHSKTSYGQSSLKAIETIRAKLGTGGARVAFTNKEANVLMDAIAEYDLDERGDELSERLTGRVPS